MFQAATLFNLSQVPFADLFAGSEFVWSALDKLKPYLDSSSFASLDRKQTPDSRPLPETVVVYKGEYLQAHDLAITYGDTNKGKLLVHKNGKELQGASVIMAGAVLCGDSIHLGKGVLVESGAMIKSPAFIGDYTEIRQAAYIRGYCLTGKRCVIGHATEVKHSVFLNDAKAGHFAYLGDSILGNNANLGAGTKFANLKMVAGNVIIRHNGQKIDTGRRKFGAILGDDSQTGCNSVTNPGTIFGKKCLLMPNTTSPAGYHRDKSLIR